MGICWRSFVGETVDSRPFLWGREEQQELIALQVTVRGGRLHCVTVGEVGNILQELQSV